MQANPQETSAGKATTPVVTADHLAGLQLAAQFFTNSGYDEFTLEMHILGDLIRQANENPAQQWTNQKPTQPGAYWIRGNSLLEPALVQVKRIDDELWCNLHMRNTEPDFEYGFAIAKLNDKFEWLGLLGGAQ